MVEGANCNIKPVTSIVLLANLPGQRLFHRSH